MVPAFACFRHTEVELVTMVYNYHYNDGTGHQIKTFEKLIEELEALGITEDNYTKEFENNVFTLTINLGMETIEYTNNTINDANDLYGQYEETKDWTEFCANIEELEGIYSLYKYSNTSIDETVEFIRFYFNGQSYEFKKADATFDIQS